MYLNVVFIRTLSALFIVRVHYHFKLHKITKIEKCLYIRNNSTTCVRDVYCIYKSGYVKWTLLQIVTIENFMEEMSFTKQIYAQTCFYIFHNFHLIVTS